MLAKLVRGRHTVFKDGQRVLVAVGDVIEITKASFERLKDRLEALEEAMDEGAKPEQQGAPGGD